MRGLLSALALYLAGLVGLAGPSIDVDQVKSDAACELVYCSLAPNPAPTPAVPSRDIPRQDPEPPIPAAAAAEVPATSVVAKNSDAAAEPRKPAAAAAEIVDRAPPKTAAPTSEPPKSAARSSPPLIYYSPPATCHGGNCRPRWRSRR